MRHSFNGRTDYLLVACLLLSSATSHAAPSQAVSQGIARLQQATMGQSGITVDTATEAANFVRVESGALSQRMAPSQGFDIQTRGFLAEYGSAFGLKDPSSELVLVREQKDAYGLGHVRYRQVYRGIPVFGAELTSLFSRSRNLLTVTASTVEINELDVSPTWRANEVEPIARQQVLGESGPGESASRKPAAKLHVINSRLVIFRSGQVQGVPGRNHLAWQLEVVNDAVTVREFVFIDAHTGKVLDQVTGIHQALDRKVSETALANVVWQDSETDPDPIPAGWAGGNVAKVRSWQDEIDGSRETYNLFSSMSGGSWRSYDGADATMRTINNNPHISCPNASWNGVSTNYCNGVTGDDTVAHEWGHAYTEYTSNLIYQWQPGALNESFSDVWGEVVDFLNDRGTDAPLTARTAGSCSVYGAGPNGDNSYRWLSGEDDPAFGGAIRDMWNPVCYGDPGKVSDTQYWCNTGDSGGVHINSGVPNHAFALIVDGGSYNGQVINGLGLLKAAHLYWNTLQMLVPSSDFSHLADTLEASCDSLVNADLPEISTAVDGTGMSATVINASDCAEVTKAITAVQLRTPPSQCNFQPLLESNPPARCADLGELESISLTDWESGLDGWTASTHDVFKPSTFDTPDWAVVSDLPDERAGSAAFVADLLIGNCAADDESGALALDSPAILLPENAAGPRVSLNHWVATEAEWDGGNLKISVNAGPFSLVPASAIEFNPYNDALMSGAAGNTNPLAGQGAFTGTNGGSVVGSWGQSQVNLSGLAAPGDTIQLRLDFGIDGCNGVIGWYVDEVEFYSCAGNPGIFADGFED